MTDITTGHYYLDDDYAMSAQKTITNGSRIVLDLRGRELKGSHEGKLFLVYGYLAVMDTVGGGRISVSPNGTGVAGAVQVYYYEDAGELSFTAAPSCGTPPKRPRLTAVWYG